MGVLVLVVVSFPVLQSRERWLFYVNIGLWSVIVTFPAHTHLLEEEYLIDSSWHMMYLTTKTYFLS